MTDESRRVADAIATAERVRRDRILLPRDTPMVAFPCQVGAYEIADMLRAAGCYTTIVYGSRARVRAGLRRDAVVDATLVGNGWQVRSGPWALGVVRTRADIPVLQAAVRDLNRNVPVEAA